MSVAVTGRMNGRKQSDDGLANRRKSLRGSHSEHTACGKIWGKARGNRRTTGQDRGRTREQSLARTPPCTAGQCRRARSAHTLWTWISGIAWGNDSCPHHPPCLLRLRVLLSRTTSQPTVGGAHPAVRWLAGIIGSPSPAYPPSVIPKPHHECRPGGSARVTGQVTTTVARQVTVGWRDFMTDTAEITTHMLQAAGGLL